MFMEQVHLTLVLSVDLKTSVGIHLYLSHPLAQHLILNITETTGQRERARESVRHMIQGDLSRAYTKKGKAMLLVCGANLKK